jgi:phenylacetate-CoA ligase
MGVTSKLSKKLPNSLTQFYYRAVPFRHRYARTYRDTLFRLLENEHRPTADLFEEQRRNLVDLLSHASSHVPFYKQYFREHGLKLKDIEGPEFLLKLPIITKAMINENLSDFIDERLDPTKLVEFKTSGSTGVKFVFKGADSMYKKEAAFVTRAYRAHGSRLYDDWSIWIRRYVPQGSDAPLFKKDHELRRVYMSAYHLNNSSVHDYVRTINDLGYKTISTYPSTAYILACLLEEENLQIPRVESIHLASEMLMDEWALLIKRVLPDVRLKAHYGQMEKASFFHQEESDDYVDNLEYGFTEFVQSDDQLSVIGTGFLNYAMPFIRYDTGDTAELLDYEVESGIGLPVRVKRFIGRRDDIIVTADGNRLPGVNFYTMMYKIRGVKMFQIIQEERDKVRVKVVPNSYWNDAMAEQTRLALSERLGSTKIYIEECTEITRNERTGKIRCIVNQTMSSTTP